jgi:hypothetical protein
MMMGEYLGSDGWIGALNSGEILWVAEWLKASVLCLWGIMVDRAKKKTNRIKVRSTF